MCVCMRVSEHEDIETIVVNTTVIHDTVVCPWLVPDRMCVCVCV